jgi:hypothetical protein
MVFGAYRKDDFADAENFLLQLGMVLERYADAVIERVSDPRNPDSLQRRCKFPPSIAEIGELADGEASRQAHAAHYRTLPAFEKREPRVVPEPANVLVPVTSPHYFDLLERARNEPGSRFDSTGLWVPFAWVERSPGSAFRRFTKADLERIYSPHGKDNGALHGADGGDRVSPGDAGMADVEGGGTSGAE